MDYTEIKPSELRVGDIIAAQFTHKLDVSRPTRLFVNVEVTRVTENVVEAQDLTFWVDLNTFYLIERPKKPLPTKIGSVVEVDGVKYIRVIEDSEWYYEWAKSVEGDTFDSVASEYLADLDYTVV